MQINLDVIVAMSCADLHVNMQDAAGDRTLAGDLLRKDPTTWAQWTGKNMERGMHELGKGGDKMAPGWEELWDVHEQLGKARKRKFSKTPRVRGQTDSCRIFGSLDGNKVQGDFHITARGHGYMEFGEHLDHSSESFYNLQHKVHAEKEKTRREELWLIRYSIQLLPHHPRAILWSLLPLPGQPSRRHHRCNPNTRRQVLQIPILPLHCTHNLHRQPFSPPLTRIRRQQEKPPSLLHLSHHACHQDKSVCRHFTES
jgi:hypothetical protein